ncbi:hypothetical protein IFM89_002730 [Coptis chinensis]|uniref:Kinesin motor domain-containing protein n=1 Tax=Coptis chinensis TaxID=261450 RepID=A0A835M742_9MAGN|nr:hypothetical protein IFM89_002730 [Coptis chinensis]
MQVCVGEYKFQPRCRNSVWVVGASGSGSRSSWTPCGDEGGRNRHSAIVLFGFTPALFLVRDFTYLLELITGSGKTYTMLGEIDELEVKPSLDRGMTPCRFEFLFARIRAEEESRRDEKLKYNCKCSLLDICNEQITDLLDPSSTNLLLREDNKKGVYVENLTEYEVQIVNDILKLLTETFAGSKGKLHPVLLEVTKLRERFSFHFPLLRITTQSRQNLSVFEGSLKEAANINKSLSTLGYYIHTKFLSTIFLSDSRLFLYVECLVY